MKNGIYSVSIIPPTEPGHYEVTAWAGGEGDVREKFPNSYTIEIQELFFTRPAYILYIGGITGFLGLLIVILKAPKLSTIASKKEPTSELASGQYSFMKQTIDAIKYPSLFFKRPLDTNTYTILRFIF